MRFLGLALSALLASSCVVVVTANCSNGVQDGDETDVDCGGATCARCGLGRFCSLNRDCTTNFCAAGVCSTSGGGGPSCSDGIKNGNETDVDCGGGTCAPCAANRMCLHGTDCQSTVCSGGLCTPHPTGAGTAPTTGQILAVKSGMGATTPSGGYGITASGVGASVVFRITALATSSQQEHFGSIWSAGGLTTLNPGCGGMCSSPAATDFLSQPYLDSGGTRIDFDFFGANTTGFDFDATLNSSGSPVGFDLFVDGVRSPQTTAYFDGDLNVQSMPATMPFRLYSK